MKPDCAQAAGGSNAEAEADEEEEEHRAFEDAGPEDQ